MRAVFDREGLLTAFQVASAVVPPRTTKPILKNVKLTAAPEQTVLLGTDLEVVSIRMEVCGVQVEDAGACLLPTSEVLAILRELRAAELRLEADNQRTLIVGDGSEFELPSEDPALFPDVPTFGTDAYHQIHAGQLREMIKRTLFAAAKEDGRYAITGCLWELEGEKVRLVATDSKRLAVVEGTGTPHGNHTTEGQSHVVPSKVMALLEKNLTDPDETISVRFSTKDVLFKTARAELHGRLLEGRFPNYKAILPKQPPIKIPLGVAALLSACRQAAILTDDDTRGVDFEFTPGKLTLKARVADKGRAWIEIPTSHQCKGFTVTFDPKLLIDMLRVLPGDAEVSLEVESQYSPAIFQADRHYSYVIQPMWR